MCALPISWPPARGKDANERRAHSCAKYRAAPSTLTLANPLVCGVASLTCTCIGAVGGLPLKRLAAELAPAPVRKETAPCNETAGMGRRQPSYERALTLFSPKTIEQQTAPAADVMRALDARIAAPQQSSRHQHTNCRMMDMKRSRNRSSFLLPVHCDPPLVLVVLACLVGVAQIVAAPR
mmetsp:Transcript_86782/g.119463  ORF Transcript_86782/g.119463 Transcript_86782/m.119463 type:complete len:180 (-) Transcript_86782:258-797(-)|eukprot:scaffold209567_cov39-Tisochrysis_lutea.AAC.2